MPTMPSFCFVLNCSMRAERDRVSFFRFPALLTTKGNYLNDLSKTRLDSWVGALKRGPFSETQLRNGRVCSKHFINGKPAALRDKLHPDWIPNQNLGYVTSLQPNTSITGDDRCSKRIKDDIEVEEESSMETTPESIAQERQTEDESTLSVSVQTEDERTVSVSVQTQLSVDDICAAFSELNNCNSIIYPLRAKLQTLDLNEDSFRTDDSKTRYFTGLPKANMLFIILDNVSQFISSHPNTALSRFQQLLLTLMKLRLNLPFKYLSYRFAVSPTTASETFYKCIDVLYNRFKPFINWPEREVLEKNIPTCFKANFGKRVAVIIDCFEVFTETPSQVINAARCWSNYKHHQTIKFLIGITPQGTVSYISEAWGGRTRDKFLTENCGFLNLIRPGDIILADRGFLIEDAVTVLGARLEVPAFTKGKSQLHPLDLETTRKIANVRIHVERVIGLLKKKFQVFHETIPISMLSKTRESSSVLDKMVVVCSAIINLCPSLIPLN